MHISIQISNVSTYYSESCVGVAHDLDLVSRSYIAFFLQQEYLLGQVLFYKLPNKDSESDRSSCI